MYLLMYIRKVMVSNIIFIVFGTETFYEDLKVTVHTPIKKCELIFLSISYSGKRLQKY